jgi:ABC-type dipeptide/oligopeptide/nickel transport system permease component
MWRVTLRESGRLVLGLFGALLLAAMISALSVAGAGQSIDAYFAALGQRLFAFAQLDFGPSAISDNGAAQELAAHAPVTLTLVVLGLVIAFLFGAPLGLLLSSGAVRRATAPVVQIVSAAPVFCAGLALAFLARNLLGWPASNGTFPSVQQLLHPDAPVLRDVLLPALTVGLAGMAAIQVTLRRAASEVQDAPFRAGLRRLGLSTLEIDRVYVAPMVFAGLFANLGEVMLALFSAAVVSEWVFKCPGAADLFVKSVALHDWNIAALILFFFATMVLAANFVGRIVAEAIAGTDRAA